MQLEPGAILASPQGRERLTIADTYVSATGRATVRYLAGDVLWTWPLHPTARVLAEMGFRVVDHEDADVLAERVRQAIEEEAPLYAAVLVRPRMGLRDQVVSPLGDLVARWLFQVESQRRVVEPGALIEHETRERPESTSHAVEPSLGVGQLQA